MDASIRALQIDDLSGVCEIEALSYTFPWSDSIFTDCLRVGYRCRGLTIENHLVAYSIFSTGAGEGHILNLTVNPENRQSGYGRLMLRDLLMHARSKALTRVYLEVRPSNRAARALYDSEGFELIGLRRNYYRGDQGREDAMVYALTLVT